MRFTDERRASAGCGRTLRWEPVDEVRNVRIVGDASSVEAFVNDGALVFSTRIYPETYGVTVDASGASVTVSHAQHLGDSPHIGARPQPFATMRGTPASWVFVLKGRYRMGVQQLEEAWALRTGAREARLVAASHVPAALSQLGLCAR